MQKNFWELVPDLIVGHDDGDGDGDGGSNDGDPGDGEGEGDEGDSSDGTAPKPKGEADGGLKAALAAERARANKADKELKALRKAKADADLAEKSELDQLTAKEQAANDKVARLSAGFLRTALDGAIRSEAAKLGFIDATDAIDGVDRTALSYEQDDDDPSVITIDQKSIAAQVKALSTKKPHFIKTGTEDGEPTGSSFGGTKTPKKTNRSDELKAAYPSLN